MRRSSVFTLSHYPKPCGLIEDGLADKQALNSTDDLRKYYGDLKMENEGKKKKKENVQQAGFSTESLTPVLHGRKIGCCMVSKRAWFYFQRIENIIALIFERKPRTASACQRS